MEKDEEKVTAEETEAEETETPAEEETDEKDTLISELTAQVADLSGKVDILRNEYARAYADAENIKKRLQNEFEQSNKYRIQSFALDILPVLDNCERALKTETSDENYRHGVEMIARQLWAALQKEGVEEIVCLNEPFDPNWHQALMSEKREDTEPGTVIEVLQKGYKLKDRLLRAAMVKISE